MKEIWYHGTNKRNAHIIQKEGFKIGSFFSKNILDAIQFGKGNYVFSVGLEKYKIGKGIKWQCRTCEIIPTQSIYSLIEIKVHKFDESFRELNFEFYKPTFDGDLEIEYGDK